MDSDEMTEEAKVAQEKLRKAISLLKECCDLNGLNYHTAYESLSIVVAESARKDMKTFEQYKVYAGRVLELIEKGWGVQ